MQVTMASRVSRGQLAVPDENLHIHHKKLIANENTDSLKTTVKKGGAKFGTRKALNDITNKSSLSHDVASKKKHTPKEEFNVAEERFLHDHRKCTEARQTVVDTFLLDLVLPGQGADTLSIDEYSGFDESKDALNNSRCHQEPEELPMSGFSEWLEFSWESPPSSPLHMDSRPSSPVVWHFENIEFTLRPDDEGI